MSDEVGLLTAEESEPRPASLTVVIQSREHQWITNRGGGGGVQLRT